MINLIFFKKKGKEKKRQGEQKGGKQTMVEN
jgi:hypothetical protein